MRERLWARFKELPHWLRIACLATAGATTLYAVWTLLVGILLFSAFSSVRTISDVTISTIAEETGLAFPRDAKLTHFVETPPVDPTWVARVTMPRSSQETFLKSASAMRPAEGIFLGGTFKSTPWWRPRKVIFQRRYSEPRTNFLVNVVASEESGLLVAYIEHDTF